MQMGRVARTNVTPKITLSQRTSAHSFKGGLRGKVTYSTATLHDTERSKCSKRFPNVREGLVDHEAKNNRVVQEGYVGTSRRCRWVPINQPERD